MVGAKGGSSLCIGSHGIHKRPARWRRRVRSMAPAGGRPGVQHGPSRVSCCVLGSQLSLGHGCGSTAARDWARQGGANRRRPRACRPWVHGVRSTPLRPGTPSPPERTHACGGLGAAGTMRHAGRTVAQAVRRHILPRKNVWDGGGSHRRSRAVSTAALWDVAKETPLTPAPARVRSSQGEEELPHALWRPCSGSSNTPNSCLVREVCWVLPLGSAVFFVGSYTEVEPAQASGSPTLAWGAGRTDGGRPSHEEHAPRQTRRTPGPHPH